MPRFVMSLLIVTAFIAGGFSQRFAMAEDSLVPCTASEVVTDVDAGTTPVPVELPSDSVVEHISDAVSVAVVFSEILPNPVGKDTEGEYIAIKNTSGAEARLVGWSIRDGKGKVFAIPEVVIGAGQEVKYMFSETGITLVNTGGELVLIDGAGVEKDRVVYPAMAEGVKFARGADGVFVMLGAVGVKEAVVPAESPAPVAMPVVVPTPVSAPIVVSATAPLITEIFPDPEGDDTHEWVELFNPGSEMIVLDGWSIDDAVGGSKPYVFPAGSAIAGTAYLVVDREQSHLTLNNDQDDVRLIDPSGVVRELVHYAGVRTGKSYARFGEEWVWSVPTMGIENPERQDAVVVAGVVGSNIDAGVRGSVGSSEGTMRITTEDSLSEEVQYMTIADVYEVGAGTHVMTEGVVTVGFGFVSKTQFVLQDKEEATAIVVRVPRGFSEEIVVGRIVRLTGMVKMYKDGPKLVMGAGDAMELGETVDVPIVGEDAIEVFGPVTRIVSGSVVSLQHGMTITATDGGQWQVTLPKGQKFDVRKGDVVTVQGIMLKEKLVVLSEKDMVIDPKKEVFQKQVDEGAGSAVGMRQLIESGVVEGSRKWWVLGLLVIGGGVGWIMYSRPRSSEVEVPAMAGFTPPLPLPQFTLSSIDNSQTTFYDSPTR